MQQLNIIWRRIALEIIFAANKFGLIDHIEVSAEDRAALPITETGYRSHFIACGIVAAHGGAIAFVTAWLEHEASKTGWTREAQQSLF